MPYEYDDDNDMATTEMKYDRNMTTDELKEVGTKDTVLYKRDDNMMTKVKQRERGQKTSARKGQKNTDAKRYER